MIEKIRQRKDIGVKIWELCVKIRELSVNGRTKATKLDYKLVAPTLRGGGVIFPLKRPGVMSKSIRSFQF